jgi:uncharacterized protein (DUF934 family)
MPLIDMQAQEIADLWHYPAGYEPVTDSRVVLPLAALLVAGEVSARPRGLRLPPDAKLAAIEPLLSELELIAIEFPKFRDGRGFTLARALREQGFQGDIRAVGHVLPDQFAFLRQCGFTSVITPAEHPPAQFAAALAGAKTSRQLVNRLLHRGVPGHPRETGDPGASAREIRQFQAPPPGSPLSRG